MKRIAVCDIMTRHFVSVSPLDSLYKCAKLIAKERVDSLILADKKKLVGILTSRDILWAIVKKPNLDLKNLKAIEIATRKVAVIKPSADISQALEKMKALNFKILPVLSKGSLTGVITLKDILAVEPELYSQIAELADVRERDRKIQGFEKDWPLEGFCENCNTFSELLEVENQLLCPDCRNELY